MNLARLFKRHCRAVLIALFCACLIMPNIGNASSDTGSIIAQYAWSENAGWVNFAPDNGNIQVTDAALTGYAWDPIYGWLNLAPDGAGVKNDGAGNLSGSAWSAGAGWVNFAGVKINSAGKFTGAARGSVYGRLSFDCNTCNVTTDWRPSSSTSTSTSAVNISHSSGYAPSYGPNGKITLITRTLSVGTTNGQVKLLQQFLNNHGFLIAKTGAGSPGHENSYFGLATKTAVIKFQKANGIKPANGLVGINTRAKILDIQNGIAPTLPTVTNTPIKIAKTLSIGSRNQEVKLLQQFLNTHGFIIANAGVGSAGRETTYFGAATRAAVIRFQQSNGIKPANGTVGPATRKVMNLNN